MTERSTVDLEWLAELERAAARSWPATTTEQRAGCLLRHSPGLDRGRSNSALPLLGTEQSVPERINAIESFYASRNRPPLVQVSPAEHHGELDQALAARGYRAHTPTMMLTTTAAAVLRAGGDHPHIAVTVHKGLDADWSTLLHECASGHDPAAEHTLPFVPDPVGFAVARLGGRPAGLAMFPAGGGWSGVFCVATLPHARRQGVASALLRAGARWAAEQGSDRLYLQVTESNRAARSLYTRHGFRPSHRYHYRRLG